MVYLEKKICIICQDTFLSHKETQICCSKNKQKNLNISHSVKRFMVSKKTFLLFFLFLILFQCVFAQYTEITDNDSIFGGYVTANRFYESDGTYVIPIYKVDWGLGFGDLEGIGLNATVRYSNLNYAIHSYWQNITNFPTDISFFNNDMGYLTNITVYTNLSQFINDVGFALTTDLTWNNISGKPTEISYWNNDVGYITMLNLTELQQQLLNESLTRNQTDDVLLSLINIVYNNVDALNTTKSGTGNCPLGYAVQNLTMGSPQCTPIMVTETDPIFMLNNATIWNGIDTIFNITNYLYTDIDNLNFSLQQQINNKLEITDQRYNDTAWVIQYFASLDIHNGTDGLNGTNGINGIDGINGTNGINGIDGLNGTNGLNGLNGMDGVNGTSLTMLSITNNFDGTFTWYFSDGTNFTTSNLTGQQGTQGIQGIAGINGIDGLNGTNGLDGLNGTNGLNGIDGVNGSQGIQGIQGIAGVNGTNGIDGINGTNGLNGVNGINGTSLIISSITNNFDGTFTWHFSDGTNFTTSNLTGSQGIQGIQGIQGVAGINGTNGIDGVNGTNGVNGTTLVIGDNIYTYNTTAVGGVIVINFNETKLNNTINKTITSIQHYFEENVTFSVSSGKGNSITVQCCSVPSEILEIAVFPTSSGNKYRFSANGSITGQVVDANLVKHTGNWIVSHSGTIISAEKITYFITNADIDETFRVRLRWEQ